MTSFRHILAPTDFSKPAEHSVAFAAQMAKALGAKLTVVHIHETPIFGFPEIPVLLGESDDAVLKYEDEEMKKVLTKLKADGVDCQGVVQRSSHSAPADLIKVAQQMSCDVIIIGTNGRRGVERVLLGSVTERVVRTSSIPVLVVPPQAPNENVAEAVKLERQTPLGSLNRRAACSSVGVWRKGNALTEFHYVRSGAISTGFTGFRAKVLHRSAAGVGCCDHEPNSAIQIASQKVWELNRTNRFPAATNPNVIDQVAYWYALEGIHTSTSRDAISVGYAHLATPTSLIGYVDSKALIDCGVCAAI